MVFSEEVGRLNPDSTLAAGTSVAILWCNAKHAKV